MTYSIVGDSTAIVPHIELIWNSETVDGTNAALVLLRDYFYFV